MTKPDEHRARSQAMLMGDLWARPRLARRDRRFITLTIAAVTAQREPLANHLRAAIDFGDVAPTELHEWVVHLAHYGGWPAATTAYAVLREVVAPRPR
jgi:4-carboxymuconolactone decarboxylase